LAVTNLSRRVTGLLSLCFLLLSGAADAVGVHACPHHTRIGAPLASAPAAHHHGHGQHGTPEHAEHGCDCATSCPAAGLTLLPPRTVSLPTALILAPVRASRPVAEVRPSRPAAFFLPYAQGPPLG
jgi:hypothetical protein